MNTIGLTSCPTTRCDAGVALQRGLGLLFQRNTRTRSGGRPYYGLDGAGLTSNRAVIRLRGLAVAI